MPTRYAHGKGVDRTMRSAHFFRGLGVVCRHTISKRGVLFQPEVGDGHLSFEKATVIKDGQEGFLDEESRKVLSVRK